MALLADTARRVRAGVRSPATLAMQAQHVRYWLERLPRALPLVKLTAARLEKVVDLEAAGRRVRRDGETRPLSGGTVRKRLSTLRRALVLCKRKGRLFALPEFPEVLYVYVPSKGRLQAYGDYLRLLAALPQTRQEWTALAVWSGQRRSDVERDTREDFDPDAVDEAGAPAPWIVVRSWKTRRRDGVRIAAAPELVRVLAPRWRTLRPGQPLVEPWPHASSQLGDTCVRIGLPRLSAQSMRHTFFTWYVAGNGFSPELLEIGGWSSLKIPSLVYAHAQPARFREQIERTALQALGPRRAPKASRKRVGTPRPGRALIAPEKEVGPPVLIAPTTPNTCPRGTLSVAGSKRRAGPKRPQAGPEPVGAERIELSTNGLRVRAHRPPPHVEVLPPERVPPGLIRRDTWTPTTPRAPR